MEGRGEVRADFATKTKFSFPRSRIQAVDNLYMGDKRGDEVLWCRAYPRLVGWTVKRYRLALADAEEVVQEAVTQLHERGADVGTDLGEVLHAVGSRINGIMRNRRTKMVDKITRPTRDGTLPDRHDGGNPEERIVGKHWASRGITLLLERVEGDATLEGIIMNGDGKPADVAVELGVGADVVYNARRRLKAHVAAVQAQLEDGEP
jgi:hypothetical protein